MTPAWLAAARPAGRPAPDPAYRARARAAFLGEANRRPVLALRQRRQSVRFAWMAAVAAAAAVVSALNQGPRWEVMPGSTALDVVLDGQVTPLTALAGRLRTGAHLTVPAGQVLELCLPGRVFVQFTGGSSMTLPRSPGRWIGRDMRADVMGGEVHFATGPAFHGARLDLELGAASAHVVGTAFAAIRDSIGSCVCVIEGAVEVTPHEGAAFMIPEGHHRVVRYDGAATKAEPLPEVEVRALGAFRAHAHAELSARPR